MIRSRLCGIMLLAACQLFGVCSTRGVFAQNELLAQHTLANFDPAFASYQHRLKELEAQFAGFQATNKHGSLGGCDCNCCCPGWFVTADYLNWRVDRDDLGFAILDPTGIGRPDAGTPVMSLDLGPDSGFRVAAGRRTSQGWEVGVKYTYLRADDAQAFAPGGDQVLAVQSSPATGLTNADSVMASSDFRYDVFDVEVGHWFDVNDSLSLAVLGGARIASIDHHLQARYDGGAFVDGLVDVPTDLDAYGGRLGGAMHWNLVSGLSLFGTTALSVLAADIDASRREVNAGVVDIDVSRASDATISVAEVALGVRYCRSGWSLGAGYEWTSWFGAVRPLEFSDSFNGGTLAPSASDLGLHGLFVTAAYAR